MAILVSCPSCGSHFRARDKHRGQDAQCPRCGHDLVLEGNAIADFDVFISYSSRDKSAADAVCVALERRRLRCWIAPRDIMPGSDWAGTIVDAIGNSRVMVLVYSANANASNQVIREVERAVSKGLVIVPLRIEDVPLSKNMEYFISASHWLDAVHGPTEEHLERLCKTVTSLIVQHQDLELSPPKVEEKLAAPALRGRRRVIAGIAAVVVLLLAIWLIFGGDRDDARGKSVGSSTPSTTHTLPGAGIVNSVKMQFAFVPAGQFMMGALDGDPNADRDERPRHPVILSKPFYLAIHELTVEQYQAVMHASPPMTADEAKIFRKFGAGDASHCPVPWLMVDQAQEFCDKLSALPTELAAHRTYRLPTEAEWEYACRAGTDNVFIGSDTLTTSQANFSGKKRPEHPVRLVDVASYPPNPWGLYDMLGNAREWCSDFKGEYPAQAQTDPQGPQSGRHRAIRGGGANDSAGECRPSARFRIDDKAPKNFRPRAGLRVACVIKD